MTGALLYLQVTSLRNAVWRRVRRLRQPRYLIATLVGAGYFYFFFFRGAWRHAGGPGPASAPVDFGLSVGLITIIALMVARLVWAWVFAPGRASLAFSEAEVAFLFPAPVSRRALVHFKLLKSQLRILFSAVLLGALFNRSGGAGGTMWTHVAGWWILFSTLELHGIAAAFTRDRLLDLGLNPARRRALLGGAVLAAGALAWWWARTHLPAPTVADRANPAAVVAYIDGLLALPPVSWVLAPFRWLAAPFLAADGSEFLRALGPALLVLAAHYFWVIRSEVAFEEASLNVARQRAERAEARHGDRRNRPARPRRDPFTLAPRGPAPVAFLWRNLIAAGPWFHPRTGLLVAGVVLAGTAWLAVDPARRPWLRVVITGAPVVGVWALLAGPMFMRREARLLMERLDVVKTLPLRGWQVVLGEMLAPIVLLTAVDWLAVAATAIAAGAVSGDAGAAAAAFGLGALGAGLLVPPVAGLLVAISLGATLCFPGWISEGGQRAGGMEALGQRLILFGGYLVVFLVALLPAGCAAFPPFVVARWWYGADAPAFLAAAVAAAAVLFGELGTVVWWLGQRYEQFDLSREMPQ